MKTTIKPAALLVLLCIVCSALQVNAQTRKSYASSSGEPLPMNRAAFIFCYNNANSYTNPAAAVLKNKINHSTSTIATTTSAPQEQAEEGMCMFSNLTQDELWVELSNKRMQTQDLQLEIYNADGERVYNSKVEQQLHKVNVCDLTAGTFLVKLGDDVQKLVIE